MPRVIVHRFSGDDIEDNELQAGRGDGKFVPRRTIDCTGMPGKLAPELDPALNFGVDLGL